MYCNTDLYYSDVLCDLTYEKTENSGNVILSVTNSGTEAAEFVEAYVLFIDKNGKVVAYDSTYFTDNDSELKGGATITKQLDCSAAYSTAEVFFTGRRYA